MRLSIIPLAHGVAKKENGFGGEGEWSVLKCFYEEGKEYGEFFFNFNLKTGEAEISWKDNGYADPLIEAFSKEMRGE